MLYYVSLDDTFKNFYLLNNHTIARNLHALSRLGFEENYKIKPQQELLSLKYDAVTFNIYSSISTFNMSRTTNFDEMRLVLIQASNNFLQSAYDVIHQLLRIMELDSNEAEKNLKDINERIKFEKNFRLDKYKWKHEVKKYADILREYYNSTLKDLRKENNYIKHSGQVSAIQSAEDTTFVSLKVKDIQDMPSNNETLQDLIQRGKKNIVPLYNEKQFNIDEIEKNLIIAIDELIKIVDLIMISCTDSTYKELVRITQDIYREDIQNT